MKTKGKLKAIDACIYWGNEEKPGAVVVLPREQALRLDESLSGYVCSGGATYLWWREMAEDRTKAGLLCLWQYWNLVHNYKLDESVAHEAMLGIKEYAGALDVVLFS